MTKKKRTIVLSGLGVAFHRNWCGSVLEKLVPVRIQDKPKTAKNLPISGVKR